MKGALICLVILTASKRFSDAEASGCDSKICALAGAVVYGDTCYKVSDNPYPWAASFDVCDSYRQNYANMLSYSRLAIFANSATYHGVIEALKPTTSAKWVWLGGRTQNNNYGSALGDYCWVKDKMCTNAGGTVGSTSILVDNSMFPSQNGDFLALAVQVDQPQKFYSANWQSGTLQPVYGICEFGCGPSPTSPPSISCSSGYADPTAGCGVGASACGLDGTDATVSSSTSTSTISATKTTTSTSKSISTGTTTTSTPKTSTSTSTSPASSTVSGVSSSSGSTDSFSGPCSHTFCESFGAMHHGNACYKLHDGYASFVDVFNICKGYQTTIPNLSYSRLAVFEDSTDYIAVLSALQPSAVASNRTNVWLGAQALGSEDNDLSDFCWVNNYGRTPLGQVGSNSTTVDSHGYAPGPDTGLYTKIDSPQTFFSAPNYLPQVYIYPLCEFGCGAVNITPPSLSCAGGAANPASMCGADAKVCPIDGAQPTSTASTRKTSTASSDTSTQSTAKTTTSTPPQSSSSSSTLTTSSQSTSPSGGQCDSRKCSDMGATFHRSACYKIVNEEYTSWMGTFSTCSSYAQIFSMPYSRLAIFEDSSEYSAVINALKPTVSSGTRLWLGARTQAAQINPYQLSDFCWVNDRDSTNALGQVGTSSTSVKLTDISLTVSFQGLYINIDSPQTYYSAQFDALPPFPILGLCEFGCGVVASSPPLAACTGADADPASKCGDGAKICAIDGSQSTSTASTTKTSALSTSIGTSTSTSATPSTAPVITMTPSQSSSASCQCPLPSGATKVVPFNDACYFVRSLSGIWADGYATCRNATPSGASYPGRIGVIPGKFDQPITQDLIRSLATPNRVWLGAKDTTDGSRLSQYHWMTDPSTQATNVAPLDDWPMPTSGSAPYCFSIVPGAGTESSPSGDPCASTSHYPLCEYGCVKPTTPSTTSVSSTSVDPSPTSTSDKSTATTPSHITTCDATICANAGAIFYDGACYRTSNGACTWSGCYGNCEAIRQSSPNLSYSRLAVFKDSQTYNAVMSAVKVSAPGTTYVWLGGRTQNCDWGEELPDYCWVNDNTGTNAGGTVGTNYSLTAPVDDGVSADSEQLFPYTPNYRGLVTNLQAPTKFYGVDIDDNVATSVAGLCEFGCGPAFIEPPSVCCGGGDADPSSQCGSGAKSCQIEQSPGAIGASTCAVSTSPGTSDVCPTSAPDTTTGVISTDGASTSSAVAGCDATSCATAGSTFYDGACYRITDLPSIWSDAFGQCESYRQSRSNLAFSRLAIFKDRTTYEAVLSTLLLTASPQQEWVWLGGRTQKMNAGRILRNYCWLNDATGTNAGGTVGAGASDSFDTPVDDNSFPNSSKIFPSTIDYKALVVRLNDPQKFYSADFDADPPVDVYGICEFGCGSVPISPPSISCSGGAAPNAGDDKCGIGSQACAIDKPVDSGSTTTSVLTPSLQSTVSSSTPARTATGSTMESTPPDSTTGMSSRGSSVSGPTSGGTSTASASTTPGTTASNSGSSSSSASNTGTTQSTTKSKFLSAAPCPVGATTQSAAARPKCVASGQGSCAYANSTQYGWNTCFRLTPNPVSWSMAAAECAALNVLFGSVAYSRLAVFTSATMYDEVMSQLATLYKSKPSVWLGAKAAQSGEYLSDYCWMTDSSTYGSQVTMFNESVKAKDGLFGNLLPGNGPYCLYVDIGAPYEFLGGGCGPFAMLTNYALCEFGCQGTGVPTATCSSGGNGQLSSNPTCAKGVCDIYQLENQCDTPYVNQSWTMTAASSTITGTSSSSTSSYSTTSSETTTLAVSTDASSSSSGSTPAISAASVGSSPSSSSTSAVESSTMAINPELSSGSSTSVLATAFGSSGGPVKSSQPSSSISVTPSSAASPTSETYNPTISNPSVSSSTSVNPTPTNPGTIASSTSATPIPTIPTNPTPAGSSSAIIVSSSTANSQPRSTSISTNAYSDSPINLPTSSSLHLSTFTNPATSQSALSPTITTAQSSSPTASTEPLISTSLSPEATDSSSSSALASSQNPMTSSSSTARSIDEDNSSNATVTNSESTTADSEIVSFEIDAESSLDSSISSTTSTSFGVDSTSSGSGGDLDEISSSTMSASTTSSSSSRSSTGSTESELLETYSTDADVDMEARTDPSTTGSSPAVTSSTVIKMASDSTESVVQVDEYDFTATSTSMDSTTDFTDDGFVDMVLDGFDETTQTTASTTGGFSTAPPSITEPTSRPASAEVSSLTVSTESSDVEILDDRSTIRVSDPVTSPSEADSTLGTSQGAAETVLSFTEGFSNPSTDVSHGQDLESETSPTVGSGTTLSTVPSVHSSNTVSTDRSTIPIETKMPTSTVASSESLSSASSVLPPSESAKTSTSSPATTGASTIVKDTSGRIPSTTGTSTAKETSTSKLTEEFTRDPVEQTSTVPTQERVSTNGESQSSPIEQRISTASTSRGSADSSSPTSMSSTVGSSAETDGSQSDSSRTQSSSSSSFNPAATYSGVQSSPTAIQTSTTQHSTRANNISSLKTTFTVGTLPWTVRTDPWYGERGSELPPISTDPTASTVAPSSTSSTSTSLDSSSSSSPFTQATNHESSSSTISDARGSHDRETTTVTTAMTRSDDLWITASTPMPNLYRESSQGSSSPSSTSTGTIAGGTAATSSPGSSTFKATSDTSTDRLSRSSETSNASSSRSIQFSTNLSSTYPIAGTSPRLSMATSSPNVESSASSSQFEPSPSSVQSELPTSSTTTIAIDSSSTSVQYKKRTLAPRMNSTFPDIPNDRSYPGFNFSSVPSSSPAMPTSSALSLGSGSTDKPIADEPTVASGPATVQSGSPEGYSTPSELQASRPSSVVTPVQSESPQPLDQLGQASSESPQPVPPESPQPSPPTPSEMVPTKEVSSESPGSTDQSSPVSKSDPPGSTDLPKPVSTPDPSGSSESPAPSGEPSTNPSTDSLTQPETLRRNDDPQKDDEAAVVTTLATCTPLEWGPFTECAVTCGGPELTRVRTRRIHDRFDPNRDDTNSSISEESAGATPRCPASETEYASCDLPKCTILTQTLQLVTHIEMNIGCVWLMICAAISIVSAGVRRVKTYLPVVQLNSDIGMLMAHIQIMFLAQRDDRKVSRAMCKAAAIGLQYSYLVVFAFQFMEALYIHNILTSVSMGNGHGLMIPLKPTVLLGWGLPAVVSAFTAGFMWNDLMSDYSCWINFLDDNIFTATFLPVLAVVAPTVILLEAAGHKKTGAAAEDVTSCRIARGSLGVVVVNNFASWFLGASAIYSQQISLFTVVFGLNISLGVLILSDHLLSDQKVRNFLKRSFHSAKEKIRG